MDYIESLPCWYVLSVTYCEVKANTLEEESPVLSSDTKTLLSYLLPLRSCYTL